MNLSRTVLLPVKCTAATGFPFHVREPDCTNTSKSSSSSDGQLLQLLRICSHSEQSRFPAWKRSIIAKSPALVSYEPLRTLATCKCGRCAGFMSMSRLDMIHWGLGQSCSCTITEAMKASSFTLGLIGVRRQPPWRGKYSWPF